MAEAQTTANTPVYKQPIVWLLLVFVGLAFAASVINPLHEATDELRHYRFVQHIVQRQSLPVQGAVGCSAQGHHPPLFYALGAVATFWIDTEQDVCYQPPTNPFWQYRYWEVGDDNKNQYFHGPKEVFPWRGEALAAHIVRGLNVLIGAGVVYLTWLLARAIWPKRPSLALGAAAFVAFNPMFVYMSGAINNDVIAAFSGTAVTLACVRLLQDERGLSRRWGVILGALFGLALLSKFNLAAVAVLIEAAVTWVAWRQKQWRRWLEVNLLIAGVTLLLAGWWFGRNQILYGEPTGFERLTELWGVRDPVESFGTAVFELDYTWTSLWGRFGYGQIPLPEAIYLGLRWLVFGSLLGLAVPLLRRRITWPHPAVSLLLLGLNVLLFFAVVFNYLLVSPAGAMGRFFFPALPALGILTFYGLSGWLDLLATENTENSESAEKREKPLRPLRPLRLKTAAILVNIGMAALTAVALWGYLAPAYARPPTFGEETAVPNPVNVWFDSFVVLRGYELSSTTLRPGEWVDVDLYWEVLSRPPGDFVLFVHLIDTANNTLVTQRDTYPGLGNFPSSQWQPGDRFVETVRLHGPETMVAPAEARLSVGFYAPGPNSYRLGITAVDGIGLGDALTLAEFDLLPAASEHDLPNPLDQNFENVLRLVGYEYSQRLLQTDDTLTVTLYWQALQASPDTVTQVQLCRYPCNPWEAPVQTAVSPAQTISSPVTKGQIVTEEHIFRFDPTIPPGDYSIHVALIDPMTKEPHNIIAEDGHQINNRLLLARVRLAP